MIVWKNNDYNNSEKRLFTNYNDRNIVINDNNISIDTYKKKNNDNNDDKSLTTIYMNDIITIIIQMMAMGTITKMKI